VAAADRSFRFSSSASRESSSGFIVLRVTEDVGKRVGSCLTLTMSKCEHIEHIFDAAAGQVSSLHVNFFQIKVVLLRGVAFLWCSNVYFVQLVANNGLMNEGKEPGG
jgi:hypothetical protein